MLAQSDTGSVVSRAVKKTPVTWPAAATTGTKDKIDVLMWDDHHITRSKLCATIGSGKQQFRPLGYRKCSPPNIKLPQNTSVQNFSSAVRKMGMLFCQTQLLGDETWFHHYDP